MEHDGVVIILHDVERNVNTARRKPITTVSLGADNVGKVRQLGKPLCLLLNLLRKEGRWTIAAHEDLSPAPLQSLLESLRGCITLADPSNRLEAL